MLNKEYDHVILLAHGSPDPLWKKPFEFLYDQVIKSYGKEKVSLAFMGLTSPSLEDCIQELHHSVNKVGVLPLFLAVGRHLRHDVPLQIESLQTDKLSIDLLPPIGDDSMVQEAMLNVITRHLGEI